MTDEEELIEFRCSKCAEIGGDSESGVYAGCPKGGSHDIAGGRV